MLGYPVIDRDRDRLLQDLALMSQLERPRPAHARHHRWLRRILTH